MLSSDYALKSRKLTHISCALIDLNWYGGFMRAIAFGFAAVTERANHYAINNYYDVFNIKAFANPFKKIAYPMVISGFILISFTIFFLTKKYTALIHCPE
jgi:hypothetical protein